MDASEAQRLKGLEDENRRLKLLAAELSLHGEALKGVIRKRLELAGLRADFSFAQAEHGLSERTACKLLGVERPSYRYEPGRTATRICGKCWSSWDGRRRAMAIVVCMRC